MGAWDIDPWGNDSGADWFGDMFEQTKLAEHVRKTLQNADPEDEHEEIRAAASMLVMLGRTYVWPIGTIDQDLTLAATRLEELFAVPELEDNEEFLEAIRDEMQELRSRIKDSNVKSPPAKAGKKWWEFWK